MTPSRVQEFLRSFGPAWIVMIADVDAPSILTAATAGASYGYGLAGFFLILVVPLFGIQEVSGRIGVATGKGLGEVIRSSYSRRTAVAASAPMALVDVVSYVAEYTGIAIGGELVGVPPLVSMPLAYAAQILIIRKRNYLSIEKVLIAISTVLVLAYAGSLVFRGFTRSTLTYFSSDPSYLFMLAASVGAVVMPFMLFYQASATAQKGGVRLWAMRTETLVGAVASEVGMIVIMMATAGLGSAADFASPTVLSGALSAVADSYAPYLFAIGLVAAAFLALVVISMASSWAIVEAMGWRRDSFFWVYVAESIPAVAIPIFYPDLLSLTLGLMVAFVFVLVGPGILMGKVASDARVMGDLASRGLLRAAYWLSLGAILAFGVVAVLAAF